VAIFDGSLNFDTKIDEKGFNKGTAKMSKSVKKLGALIAAAFSVRVLVGFSKQALKVASDLQEVQNVVDVVFKEMSKSIDNFAKNAIEKFGLSELSAKQYASTLGSMGASMGIAAQQNLEMSKTLTGLIGDYASFHNITQDRAATALKGIYTGETEALKGIGKVMTQVNLQEFARQEGITKSIKLMNQQEKVMLRFNYIMSVSENEMGDFARTSQSWANQTRILSERWKQLLGLIGDNLIRVLTPAIQLLNKLVNLLIIATEQFNAFYAAVNGKEADVNNQVASSISSSVDEQDNLTDAVEDTNKALKGTLASFDDVNVLQEKSAGLADIELEPFTVAEASDTEDLAESNQEMGKIFNSLMRIYEAIQAIKTGFSELFTNISENTEPFIKWINEELLPAFTVGLGLLHQEFSRFVYGLEPLLDVLTGFTNDILDTIIKYWGDNLPKIVNDVIAPFGENLLIALGGILDSIAVLWNKHGTKIFTNISEAYQSTADLLTKIYDKFLGPIIEKALEAWGWLWENHLNGLIYEVGNFVLELIDAVVSIYDGFILPLVSFLVDILGPIFVDIFKFIIDVLATFIGFVADVAGALLRILSGIIKFIVGVFTLDWDKAWSGLGDIFLGIMDGIIAIFTGVINLIIDGMNFLVRELNNIKIDVPDWVPGIGGKQFGFDISELQKLQTSGFRIGRDVPTSVASSVQAPVGNQYGQGVGAGTQTRTETIVIKFEGDLADIARLMKPELDDESKRKGQTMEVQAE